MGPCSMFLVKPDSDVTCWLGGAEHFGSTFSPLVNIGGYCYDVFRSGAYGIRPALVVSQLHLDSEAALSDVPTKKLMEELWRRIEK